MGSAVRVSQAALVGTATSGTRRSKNPGFTGIDTELYFADNTWMVLGDAKKVVGELSNALSESTGGH